MRFEDLVLSSFDILRRSEPDELPWAVGQKLALAPVYFVPVLVIAGAVDYSNSLL